MRKTLASLFLSALVGVAACGDDSAADGAVVHDQSVPHDLSMQGEGGTGMFTLTLDNYLNWCSVTVNSGAASTSSQTLMFAPNTVVNLGGDKASATFEWGYWFGTAGDTTSAHDTAMMTTVVMSGNKKIQACCPFSSGPQAHVACPAP